VVEHPDHVAAEAAPVIDRGVHLGLSVATESGDESHMSADQSHTHLAKVEATVIPR
jgi:hypothetical protein